MDRFELKDNFNGAPAIMTKIDALTIVFNNMSFVDVIKSIGISEILSPDYVELFNSRFLTSFGYGSDLKMTWNGIGLAAHTSDILTVFNCNTIELLDYYAEDVMVKPLPYIKVDMMGQALDYVRSLGVDIDSMVFKPLTVPEGAGYHYTRLDFAYDLLNYMGEFVDLCKAACSLYQNENHLIHTAGSCAGTTFSSRGGDQNTLYIGKGGSNFMLRIYDKKMQYERSGKYVTDCPYFGVDDITGERILPKTWVRVELQTRRVEGAHWIVSQENSSFLTIFRYIYEKYAIKEGTGRNVPVCQFWNDLFDWDLIPTIIQNAKCVKVDNNPFNRAITYFENTALGTITLLASCMGPDAFFAYVNNLLAMLQQSDTGQLRFNRIRQKILESNNGLYPAYFEKKSSGLYQITRFKTDDDYQPHFFNMFEELEKLS